MRWPFRRGVGAPVPGLPGPVGGAELGPVQERGRLEHGDEHPPHAGLEAAPRVARKERGDPHEVFLGYLLGRSHFQFFGQIRQLLAAEGLNDDEFYVLASLTLRPTTTAAELDGLPGIGPVLAQRIVDWRAANGRFGTVAEVVLPYHTGARRAS